MLKRGQLQKGGQLQKNGQVQPHVAISIRANQLIVRKVRDGVGANRVLWWKLEERRGNPFVIIVSSKWSLTI